MYACSHIGCDGHLAFVIVIILFYRMSSLNVGLIYFEYILILKLYNYNPTLSWFNLFRIKLNDFNEIKRSKVFLTNF